MLPGSPTIDEWYSGVIVLVVLKGEGVLDLLMFYIMHVRIFVGECCCKQLQISIWRANFMRLTYCIVAQVT
jgi:hypothetical protein